MPTHSNRLFFALLPGSAAVEQMASLGQQVHSELGLSGRLSTPEKLHMTLHYLGQFASHPSETITLAKQAADAVERDSVQIRLDALGSFEKAGASAPLVLRIRPGSRRLRGLRSFRQALGIEMGRVGLPLESRFEPHVTLGYDRVHVPLRTVETIEWRADSFALVLSSGGAYETLARWPLTESKGAPSKP